MENLTPQPRGARQLPFQGRQVLASPETHSRPATQGLSSVALGTESSAPAGRACAKAQRRDCYKGEGDRGIAVALLRKAQARPAGAELSVPSATLLKPHEVGLECVSGEARSWLP